MDPFNLMIDAPAVKESLNESIKDIAQTISESGGFDLDAWLNQDFTVTLNNYSQLLGNSLGIDLNDFNDLTRATNEWYGSNMTAEEYGEHTELEDLQERHQPLGRHFPKM